MPESRTERQFETSPRAHAIISDLIQQRTEFANHGSAAAREAAINEALEEARRQGVPEDQIRSYVKEFLNGKMPENQAGQ